MKSEIAILYHIGKNYFQEDISNKYSNWHSDILSTKNWLPILYLAYNDVICRMH